VTGREGTRDEWRAARVRLLAAEKALTRQSDAVAEQRRALPWVRIDDPYRFDTEQGAASLADLFAGRSQLLVYHFMYAPDWTAGCPSCSSIAETFDGMRTHLEHHDVTFTAISRAPLEKLLAYRRRMGWSFPWSSSADTSFNFDFGVSYSADQLRAGAEHNWAPVQADLIHGHREDEDLELQGMSAFALSGGQVFHTYSAYARGVDALWTIYQWLDRAPLGRNESGPWQARHDGS
jgi:predicted dithiol-disulfide oxidoreductase (DUF899 family)